MREVSKTQFASNSLWKFGEIICCKIVSLIISTILARLLMPTAYGVVALTTVFITFSDIFILNGFNVALVRKESVTDIDYSTVTSLSLGFSSILYLIIYFSAPQIASFYKTPELCPVLRVIMLLLFFQAPAAVIRANATRTLQFRKMSVATIIGTTSASVIGLIMAFMGYGVWSLVIQQVLTNVFDFILLMLFFRWRLSFKFDISIAKEMVSFTIGVLGTSFLDFLGNNANSLVIGKAYSSGDLGYYNRGNMYPETISLNVYNSITSVLLPTLASRQNDNEGMKRVVRKVLSVTTYIIFPMMFGLLAVSDYFVRILLTDKWISCVPIMICACLCYSINPIRAIGYNVFYAKGESNKCVQIEVFRCVIMIANLLITILCLKMSIYVLTGINVVVALLVAIITQIMVSKSINYSAKELFADIMPTLVMSSIMVCVVRAVTLVPLGTGLVFLLQIGAGVLVYLLLSVIFRNKSFLFLWEYILGFIKKRQSRKEGEK